MNITVLGAGAWGTAIAIHLAKRHSVMLWDRNKKVVSETVQTRQNMTGLPGFTLPESIILTSRFEDAVDHGSGPDALMIVATSVSGLRSVSGRLKDSGVINLIWLCKGFEENTGLLPNQVVAQTLGNEVDMGVLHPGRCRCEKSWWKPPMAAICAFIPAMTSPVLKSVGLSKIFWP